MSFRRVIPLYVPQASVYEVARCETCGRTVLVLPVRYYLRTDHGRLVNGFCRMPEPHRARCGAYCSGARVGPDFKLSDPLHRQGDCQPCREREHTRRTAR